MIPSKTVGVEPCPWRLGTLVRPGWARVPILHHSVSSAASTFAGKTNDSLISDAESLIVLLP